MARTIPGQTITERLFNRIGRRAQVGPKPSFYRRLGVEDPLAVDPQLAEDARKEMFSFLSAAAYYEDLARMQLRGRMLWRIDAVRHVPGSRVRAIGPRALEVRPSMLAAASDVLAPELLQPMPLAPSADEPVSERPMARRQEGVRATTRHTDLAKRRETPTPMRRVMESALPADGMTVAMTALARATRGADRERLQAVASRMDQVPVSQRAREAKRAIRGLRGTAGAMARAQTEVLEAEDASPVQVAQRRMMPGPSGRAAGLRRVLGDSPALLVVEDRAPETAPAPDVRQARRSVQVTRPARPVRTPEAAPLPRAVQDARTQVVSGRAGPEDLRAVEQVRPARPEIASPVRATRPRRPTEWVAALSVAEEQGDTSVQYGLPAAGARPAMARGTERVAFRALAGQIQPERGSVASAATRWIGEGIRATRPSQLARSVQPSFSHLEPPAPVGEGAEVAEGTSPRMRRAAVAEARAERVLQQPATRARHAAARGEAAGVARRDAPSPVLRAISRVPEVAAPVRELLASSPVEPPREWVARLSELVARRPVGAQLERALRRESVRSGATEATLLQQEIGERSTSPRARLEQPIARAQGTADLATPFRPRRSRQAAQAPMMDLIAVAPQADDAAPLRTTAQSPSARAIARDLAAASRVRMTRPVADAQAPVERDAAGRMRSVRRAPWVRPVAASPFEPQARLGVLERPAVEGPRAAPEPPSVRASKRLDKPSAARLSASPVRRPAQSVAAVLLTPDPLSTITREEAAPQPRATRPISEPPTVRAARRASPAPSVDGRGVSRLAARPVETASQVAQSAGPVAVGTTVRAAARSTRKVRQSETGALLSPVVARYAEAPQGTDPTSVVRPTQPGTIVERARVGGTLRAATRDASPEAVRHSLSASRAPSQVLPLPDAAAAGAESTERLRVQPTRPGRRVVGQDLAQEGVRASRAERLAARAEARKDPVRHWRALTHVPTSYLALQQPVEPTTVDVTPAGPQRPVQRAAARSLETTRLDGRGRALTLGSPTDYLTLARPEGVQAASRAQEAAPAGVRPEVRRQERGRAVSGRRPRALDAQGFVLVDPLPEVEPGEAPVSTARAAARAAMVDTPRTGVARRAEGMVQVRQPSARAGSAVRAQERGLRRERSLTPRVGAPERISLLAQAAPEIQPERIRRRPLGRPAPVTAAAAGRAEPELRVEAGVERAFDRATLDDVLRRVATIVRAADRDVDGVGTVQAARRVLGQAPVRRQAPGIRAVGDTVFVRPVEAPAIDAPMADRPRPTRWAETRAAIRPSRVQLHDGVAHAPGARLVTRMVDPGPIADRDEARRPGVIAGFGEPSLLRVLHEAPFIDEAGSIRAPARPTRSLGTTWRYLATQAETEARPTERFTARSPIARRPALDERFERGDWRPHGVRSASAFAPAQTLPAAPVASVDEAPTESPVARGSMDAAPAWARRAVQGGPAIATGVASEGAPALSARSAGLIGALARASRAEEVVRIILDRGDAARALTREMPSPVTRLIERIVASAEPSQATRAEGGRGATIRSRSVRTVRRDVLHPVRTYTTPSSSSGGTSRGHDGVGASNVMKLANKLMNLIHLAEVERKVQEAQKHVRMAENTADARAEGGAGAGGGETGGDQNMNIKALQQEVLSSVLRELELNQQRREDPDGRNIWW